MRFIYLVWALITLAAGAWQPPAAGSGPRYAGWGWFDWDAGHLWAKADNRREWDGTSATWDYFQWE